MHFMYICNDNMLYSGCDNLQHHSVRVNYIALAEPQTGIDHIQQFILPSLLKPELLRGHSSTRSHNIQTYLHLQKQLNVPLIK